MDGYDNEIDLFFTTKLDTKRWKAKKVEKRKPVFSEEEKKKKAAIECLTAVSDEVIPVTCTYISNVTGSCYMYNYTPGI